MLICPFLPLKKRWFSICFLFCLFLIKCSSCLGLGVIHSNPILLEVSLEILLCIFNKNMGLIMNLHVILCKNENFSISFKFSKYLTRVRSFPVILCLFTSPYLMSSYSCHLCSIHADVILCSTVQISEFLPVMCHWSSYLLSLDFTLLIYKMGII